MQEKFQEIQRIVRETDPLIFAARVDKIVIYLDPEEQSLIRGLFRKLQKSSAGLAQFALIDE